MESCNDCWMLDAMSGPKVTVSCTNLKAVEIKSETPPEIGNNAFPTKVTVVVPTESVDYYRTSLPGFTVKEEHTHNKNTLIQDNEDGHHWECTECGYNTEVEAHTYAIQIATSSEEDEKPVSSQYGIGAKVVYQHHFTKYFFVEGGIGWDTFLMKDEDPETLTNLIYFGGVGFTQSFKEVLSINAHVDIAGDTLLYDKSASETISLKTGINCVSVVNENISLTFDDSFDYF